MNYKYPVNMVISGIVLIYKQLQTKVVMIAGDKVTEIFNTIYYFSKFFLL